MLVQIIAPILRCNIPRIAVSKCFDNILEAARSDKPKALVLSLNNRGYFIMTVSDCRNHYRNIDTYHNQGAQHECKFPFILSSGDELVIKCDLASYNSISMLAEIMNNHTQKVLQEVRNAYNMPRTQGVDIPEVVLMHILINNLWNNNKPALGKNIEEHLRTINSDKIIIISILEKISLSSCVLERRIREPNPQYASPYHFHKEFSR